VGGGLTDLSGYPAFQLAGQYMGAAGAINQTVTIVDISDAEPRQFLYVTSSVPQTPAASTGSQSRDEEMLDEHARSAAEAQSVIDSVTISAPGS
jgi:hypothetical protein